MALKKCKHCEVEIAKSVKKCPQCGGKQGAGLIAKFLYFCLVMGALTKMAGLGDGDSSTGGSTSSRSSSIPSVPLPQRQQDFHGIVAQYKQTYVSAPNELKKSLERTKRQEAFKEFFSNGMSFTNWVGKLRDLETTGEGNAHVTFKLSGEGDVSVGNTNNEFDSALEDLSGGKTTLVKQTSPLFAKLAELESGAIVLITGEFIKDYDEDSGGDFIEEMYAFTEGGAMKSPTFHIRVEDVQKQ